MAKVHIQFERVQSWLFSVPHLRAMVGANALIGEVLRVRLPELAGRTGEWRIQPSNEAFPATEPEDPLRDIDDPASDAHAGIVSRDGGHFLAVFSNGAARFAEQAALLIERELPGLRFRISIDEEVVDRGAATLSPELPVLAPCEWMGQGLASVAVRQGNEYSNVSLEVSHRHHAAKRVDAGTARDLASMMTRRTSLGQRGRPPTFADLAAGEYLAVLHADGNGVGAVNFETEPERAFFHHRNRVLLRRALKFAIDNCCAAVPEGPAPLLVLMLGGDDLLVACRASVALPFVVDLCEELDRLQPAKSGEQFCLTLGVGAVISRVTVPFHRLHAVAEALASSSKRKVREAEDQARASVVDWAIYTAAWADDPAEVRARDWIRGPREDQRVLSRRPMLVLGEGHDSLQGVVRSASRLKEAPRSQLRFLVEQLSRGLTLSELAMREASSDTRRALEAAGVTTPWTRSEKGGVWLTSLLDLVEVLEIPRLGRARRAEYVPSRDTDQEYEMEAAHAGA